MTSKPRCRKHSNAALHLSKSCWRAPRSLGCASGTSTSWSALSSMQRERSRVWSQADRSARRSIRRCLGVSHRDRRGKRRGSDLLGRGRRSGCTGREQDRGVVSARSGEAVRRPCPEAIGIKGRGPSSDCAAGAGRLHVPTGRRVRSTSGSPMKRRRPRSRQRATRGPAFWPMPLKQPWRRIVGAM